MEIKDKYLIAITAALETIIDEHACNSDVLLEMEALAYIELMLEEEQEWIH